MNTDINKNIFKIGDIVTLKSHPLAFQENGLIDYHINQIPPLMCVKEIHFENTKKIYSEEFEGSKVADKIKYLCVYFNQHRMIFEEKFIYESMLCALKELTFHNNEDNGKKEHKTLVEEAMEYTTAEYKFGKRVFFKTYKLEKRKKFKSFKPIKNEELGPSKEEGSENALVKKIAMCHTSPAFIVNGVKTNEIKSRYHPKDGQHQRIVTDVLYKVLWYNSYQEKISEEYLPKMFFTDDKEILQ